MKETKWNRLRFQPCLPLGEDGRRVTSSKKHIDLAHRIATEGIVLLKNFDAYYYGYDEDGVHHAGFVELVDELTLRFPLGIEIIGESEQREFIRLFSSILRLI